MILLELAKRGFTRLTGTLLCSTAIILVLFRTIIAAAGGDAGRRGLLAQGHRTRIAVRRTAQHTPHPMAGRHTPSNACSVMLADDGCTSAVGAAAGPALRSLC